jgi:hypothetical protein
MTSVSDQLAAADLELVEACRTGVVGRIDRAIKAIDQAESLDRMSKPTPSLIGSALWYAEQGLRVFPLTPGTKIPFAKSNGCLDASSNPDIIRGWWDSEPASNVGIATGYRVDVVDIDGLKGQITRAHRPELFDIIEQVAIGKVLTPRPGGMHLYVPAVASGNLGGALEGVDYRGLGGYVVAPPSVVTEGPNPGTYSWLRPPTF